ncbi:uncharacterized protein LOC143580146 [Bidens hawaiensis]|uniref:uncharacterized protein LOC143580146 n=1 Tax=Bidens hawaiensis TaxID=980011 RepID=UPI0040494816
MDQTMDDIKFIGFAGVFSRSFKTIFNSKKIFAQITLTLILPLTLIFIAHMEISYRFFYNIESNPYKLLTGSFDGYHFDYTTTTTANVWRGFFMFKIITLVILTTFIVLSTASIVYTVMCVYTGRDVTFLILFKVVPKVWKRLIVTLLLMLLILLAYSLIASVVIFACNVVFGLPTRSVNIFTLIYIVVYAYGYIYLSIIWQIAVVTSILESSHGTRAMIKSTDLINGKRKTAIMVSYVLYQFLAIVLFVYMTFVMSNQADLTLVWQVVIGIICGSFLLAFFLVIIVAQTVLYVACKSHHRETIEVLSLSTYLSSYLSDSGPVLRMGEDIQLGRTQNRLASQV